MLGQIFNVGVPIFFILSGYLHGQKETPKNKLKWYGRKLHRLLLPLYIFVAALAAAYLAAGLPIDLSIWGQTIIPICGLTQKYIPGCGQLWFLTHLLICYLLTPLLQEHTRLGKRGIVLMLAIWLVVCVLLAYTVPPIWCTLLNSLLSYFFSYRSSLLIAAQRNYIVSGISYAVAIVQSILQMLFLLSFRNYIGYLLIQTAGTFLFNVIVSCVAVKQFPYIRKKNTSPLPKDEQHTLFANVRDLMVYKVSGLLVNSTDNILITFFKGLATTGVASNYTLLVSTLNSLIAQVFNGLTASIGNHNASEPVEKRYQMFSFLNMMNFWIFGWAALGIYFCSSDLVQLCFGEEYVLSNEIPFVMALNFFTVGMMNAVWTYKHTLGLFHYGRFIQFFTGILNIAFSVLLGTYWGLFGILFATFIARLFTSLWYDPYAVFKYGFQRPLSTYAKKIAKYLVTLAVSAISCRISFLVVSGEILTRTLLKMALCSLVSNTVFWISFHRSEEFSMLRDILQRVVLKLRKKA